MPPFPHSPIPTRQPAPALKTRARLVDELLNRPEYADYWGMRWSDILRVDKDALTPQGAVAMTRWLRRQFAENRSEERRVGKECRSRWSPNHEKKNVDRTMR